MPVHACSTYFVLAHCCTLHTSKLSQQLSIRDVLLWKFYVMHDDFLEAQKKTMMMCLSIPCSLVTIVLGCTLYSMSVVQCYKSWIRYTCRMGILNIRIVYPS